MYGDNTKWANKCIEAAKKIDKNKRDLYINKLHNGMGIGIADKKFSINSEESIGIILLWHKENSKKNGNKKKS